MRSKAELPKRRASAFVAGVVALAALTGCESPFGIGQPWIDGEWVYQSAMTAPEGVCEITGLVLDLDQDGRRFAGVANGGTLSCSILGVPVTRSLGGTPITSGEIEGQAIRFNLGAGELRHEGIMDGRSMAGTLTTELDLGGSTVIPLEGEFAAARAPR